MKKLIFSWGLPVLILVLLWANISCRPRVPEIISFTASLEIIFTGRDSILSWVTEDAQSCMIDNGVGNLPSNGFVVVGPTATTTYTLTAIGDCDKQVTASLTVTVNDYESSVLQWLKCDQDLSANGGRYKLLGSQDYQDAYFNTYNNSIAAMCFILRNEKERAELILDFFKNATVKNNTDIKLQNFFYSGEARGFYQQARYVDGKYERAWDTADRWIGDMAFLLLSCSYYDRVYGSSRYQELKELIRDLFSGFYTDNGDGGYIRHGWRYGDAYLHESSGHHEGNIDCYAALKLCGEAGDAEARQIAEKIKIWLDSELNGSNTSHGYPLDLYTWRAIVFGGGYCRLLDIPENPANGYKKTVVINIENALFNGEIVTGFYHGPADISNIWMDGTGHMACAYNDCNNKELADFYIQQLEKMFVKITYEEGASCSSMANLSLPYTITNNDDNYRWVDPTKGFVSAAAWYIFAKNNFNPFLLLIRI
ncbi:MAG: hypothetical protein KAT34_02570 [Candidatus Aminicenantes bacterium]|nr:hypothetical protein [Candidatus Aminicenantes bacterium]